VGEWERGNRLRTSWRWDADYWSRSWILSIAAVADFGVVAVPEHAIIRVLTKRRLFVPPLSLLLPLLHFDPIFLGRFAELGKSPGFELADSLLGDAHFGADLLER
jgi:hypothetical protein